MDSLDHHQNGDPLSHREEYKNEIEEEEDEEDGDEEEEYDEEEEEEDAVEASPKSEGKPPTRRTRGPSIA